MDKYYVQIHRNGMCIEKCPDKECTGVMIGSCNCVNDCPDCIESGIDGDRVWIKCKFIGSLKLKKGK
jgi:hypothetical protein